MGFVLWTNLERKQKKWTKSEQQIQKWIYSWYQSIYVSSEEKDKKIIRILPPKQKVPKIETKFNQSRWWNFL